MTSALTFLTLLQNKPTAWLVRCLTQTHWFLGRRLERLFLTFTLFLCVCCLVTHLISRRRRSWHSEGGLSGWIAAACPISPNVNTTSSRWRVSIILVHAFAAWVWIAFVSCVLFVVRCVEAVGCPCEQLKRRRGHECNKNVVWPFLQGFVCLSV